MLKKLRRRFICINMAIVAGMLLIIFGLVFQLTKTDLQSKNNTAMQILVQSVRETGKAPDIRMPYFVIRFDLFGNTTISGKTSLDLSDTQFVSELLQQVYNDHKESGQIQQYDLLYTIVSAPTSQNVIFLDISGNNAALSSLVQMSLLTGIVALAAFAGISILLARWAVKPVDKAWQQQKQFVSDASHELKTPLTVIMGNAELLNSPECDEESKQCYTEAILSSSHQMRNLVEGLLELSRADNGQIQTNFQPLNLSKLVNERTLPYEAVFFEEGLILESHIETEIFVQGSQQHLQQLIDILLDNAQKYSAPGIVDITFRAMGNNQCLLSVSNPGTPIPAEDLEKIFQRFYRADNARSNTGSFGLGLSIAQQIVRQHNGRIWAESNASGNRFNVLLPCIQE